MLDTIMSAHLERFTVLATAAMLLSLPAAASDWENLLGVYGIGVSISGTGTIRDLVQDFDAGSNERLALDLVYHGPQLGVFFKF